MLRCNRKFHAGDHVKILHGRWYGEFGVVVGTFEISRRVLKAQFVHRVRLEHNPNSIASFREEHLELEEECDIAL